MYIIRRPFLNCRPIPLGRNCRSKGIQHEAISTDQILNKTNNQGPLHCSAIIAQEFHAISSNISGAALILR